MIRGQTAPFVLNEIGRAIETPRGLNQSLEESNTIAHALI